MKSKRKARPPTAASSLFGTLQATDNNLRGNFEAGVKWLDAKPGDAASPKRFEILAYTGKPFRPTTNPPLKHPIIVDLAGMDMRKRIAALKDHDTAQLVGHVDETQKTDALILRGAISGTGDAAKEVLAASANGFEWEASIGASYGKVEFVPEGKTVVVNGRTWPGPLHVARASRIHEISFVVLGADDETSARIAAQPQEIPMNFEQWLKAKGFDDVATLSTAQRASLQAMFDAETAGAGGDDKDKAKKLAASSASKPKPKVKKGAVAVADEDDGEENGEDASADLMAEFREGQASEMERMHAISEVCGTAHAKLAAQAIRENWTVEKTELQVLKASRPQAPSVHSISSPDITPDVLSAGFCMAGGLRDLEKRFTAPTLEAANKAFKGGANVSMQRMLLNAARANGYQYDFVDKSAGGMKDLLVAAFSTRTNVTGIFTNTANKFLLEGYSFVEQVWRMIATIRNVSDFKAVTSYRLTDALIYEQLGPAGEIKHGALGEQSFTNQARTYAKMLGITREDIINDDLGALTALPRRLGRGGALTLNKIFWKTFQADTALFSDSNVPDNLAASALGIAGLTTVKTQFDSFTDDQGEILGSDAAILLVPSALEMLALQLMSTTTLVGGGTTVLNSNTFAGKYKVVASKYLNNAPTAWYLLADPRDIPSIEVAFLNGVETPTVETADVDFNTLGIQMRGYHDFGVGLQDFRAGVKSVG